MKTENSRVMKMTHEAYYAMLNYIGSRPAESGGILFGYEDDFVIRKFIPDEFASTTRASYTMNTDFINSKIRELWEDEKLSLLGIVHSHPNGNKSLSSPDRHYFIDLMTYIGLDVFYTPIINTMADGQLDCHAYAFEKDSKKPVPTHLYLVPDDYKELDEVVNPSEENDYNITMSNTFYMVPHKEKEPSILTYSLVTMFFFLLFAGLFSGTLFYLFLSMLRILF